MRRPRETTALLSLLALTCPGSRAVAQVQTNSTATALGRALMAERNASWAEAAIQYGGVLKTQPASVAALLGMEHVLPRLGRRGELIPLVEAAVAADSGSIGVLTVAVRVFAAAGQPDSTRRYAARWAARAPGDEDPYREWSAAAMEAHDPVEARRALDIGRQQLGSNALGIERAQLLQRSGEIGAAVQEWIAVVHATPVFRDGAVSVLSQATAAQRPTIREVLQKNGSVDARQLLGLLQGLWGEPTAAMTTIMSSLPADHDAASMLLHKLYDELRNRDDHASRIAGAEALEAAAAREPGPGAVHTLMDAARIYADAGDEKSARRMLSLVAANPAAPPGMSTAASTTMLGVLIAEGKAAEAESVLAGLRLKLLPDDHDRLARRIAGAWIRRGELAHAEALVAGDSSTAGFDLRGRLRLYRGDLAGANDLLKAAGPYDDAREQALERVTLLTLIQTVGTDSSVALGNALLALAREDSARALQELSALAGTLKPGAAAETRLLAARIAVARRDTAAAMQLLHAADVKEAPASAAAARLALARIDASAGRVTAARSGLEQLIIDFPESAVVPEARRLRDSLATPAGGR